MRRKHWNWTAKNKDVGKKSNLFFSYTLKLFSLDGSLIPRHAFVQDTISLPQRQSEKKKDICSIMKCFSPSSAVFCLHFRYKEKWKKIKIKFIKQRVISALLLPLSDMLPYKEWNEWSCFKNKLYIYTLHLFRVSAIAFLGKKKKFYLVFLKNISTDTKRYKHTPSDRHIHIPTYAYNVEITKLD